MSRCLTEGLQLETKNKENSRTIKIINREIDKKAFINIKGESSVDCWTIDLSGDSQKLSGKSLLQKQLHDNYRNCFL